MLRNCTFGPWSFGKPSTPPALRRLSPVHKRIQSLRALIFRRLAAWPPLRLFIVDCRETGRSHRLPRTAPLRRRNHQLRRGLSYAVSRRTAQRRAAAHAKENGSGNRTNERDTVTKLGRQYIPIPWHCPFPHCASVAWTCLMEETRISPFHSTIVPTQALAAPAATAYAAA